MEDIHAQLLRSVNNLGEVVDALRTELREHMATEELEDKEIADRIRELSDKIDSFAPMKKAFVHIDGAPDYNAHHECQMRRATDERETKKRVDKLKDWVGEVIVKGVSYAFIALLLLGARDWVQQQSAPQPVQHSEVSIK